VRNGPAQDREPLLERRPTSLKTQERHHADDDCMSSFMQSGRTCGGGLVTALCILFVCFGCGPTVTIKPGHRAAVLRFGKLDKIVGPGFYYYNPCVEEYQTVSVQIQTLDVPAQNVITKDNISVVIHAVIYYKVINVEQARFSVSNVHYAILNLAQATLRTIIGENTMDELFNSRQKIMARLTQLVDDDTELWGVKVSNIEMKDIHIPDQMQRVMAAVAEAQREGAAKVISAEAELKASTTLAEAADVLATNPLAIQLRYFQTLTEIASERSTTIVVPSDIGGLLGRSAAAIGAAPSASDANFDYEKILGVRRQVQVQRDERLARERKYKEDQDMVAVANNKRK